MRYTLMVLGLSSVVVVNTACSGNGSPAVATPSLGSVADGVAMRTPFRPPGSFPWALRSAQTSLLRSAQTAPLPEIPRSGPVLERRWPEKVVYAFNGPDGAYPNPVITGPHGVLYGTTAAGGAYISQCYALGCGTVFQLTPPGEGQSAWTETVLYSFSGGADGGSPDARMTLGAKGVLYGTTYAGGANNFGTVFALTPPPPGQTNWTESVLYSFTGAADGGNPYAAITDLRGSLYSTTSSFGTLNGGVAFRLSPPAPGQMNWTETVIHAFGAPGDGSSPSAGFTVAGNTLLSTTTYGGGCRFFSPGCGTVYELTPKGQGNREWRETILHAFTGFDGLWPYFEPALSQSGQLYATGAGGGGGCGGLGCGTAIEMTPPLSHRRTWHSHLIFYFGQKSVGSSGALLADGTGNVFGESQAGGPLGDGVIFELSPPRRSGLWTETILHRFSGANGSGPYGELTIGTKSHIYGVTYAGGTSCACGVVFQLNP